MTEATDTETGSIKPLVTFEELEALNLLYQKSISVANGRQEREAKASAHFEFAKAVRLAWPRIFAEFRDAFRGE